MTATARKPAPAHPLIGSSPRMSELRRLLAQVGRTDASVLITGPSGSGKELAARALHEASPRAAKPFIAINCGAIPRELLESELFGHEKGAFTGAHAQRIGKFEAANGGTIFLDEIGDMPADMQVKLLRVLEERRIERVGATRSLPVDVRIVSATHRNLEEAILDGRFREDLYYRLNVFPVPMPALAERHEDVPELIAHFAARAPAEAQVRFQPVALARLAQHSWPGNVRELKNFVERAAIRFAGEEISAPQAEQLLLRTRLCPAEPDPERHALMSAVAQLETLATPAPKPAAAPATVPSEPKLPIDPAQILASGSCDLRTMLATLEQSFIETALANTGGVVADAARLLGLQRTTLVEKMRRYNLARAPHEPFRAAA